MAFFYITRVRPVRDNPTQVDNWHFCRCLIGNVWFKPGVAISPRYNHWWDLAFYSEQK